MRYTITAVFLASLGFFPSTLADTECTQSNASKYTEGGGSSDGCSAADIARDDTGCVKEYCSNGGTSASLQACFCIALGETNCTPSDEERRDVKRQAFTCSDSEKCYINPADGGLFCLDASTGSLGL